MMPLNSGITERCERSLSKISIYNYPDHLNPFYDEDNHKRLRFWNLSKSNENSKRRSFSIGNLRDVWNFRSFNLKKKSSTLGIQKTSESPPILRRNIELATSSLHQKEQTPDNRRPILRSLQNVNAPIGMSNCNSFYQGSTKFDRRSTPQPQQYYTTRSSFSSLSSTNPFESDIESDINGSVSGGFRTKSYRKKRKAPLAPIQTMVRKPSTETIEQKDASQGSYMEARPDIDIKSLTNEIERFVNQDNESSTTKLCMESNTQPSNKVRELSTATVPEKPIEACHSVNMENKQDRDIESCTKKIESDENPEKKTSTTKLLTVGSCMQTDPRHTNEVRKLSTDQANSTEAYQSVNMENNKDIGIKSLTNEIERFVNHRKEISNNKSLILEFSTDSDTRRTGAIDISLQSTNVNTNHKPDQKHISESKSQNSENINAPNIVNFATCKHVIENLQVDKVNSNFMESTEDSNRNDSLGYKCNNEYNYNVESSEYLNKPLTIFEKAEKKTPRIQEKAVKMKSVKDIIDSINRSQQLLKESAAKGTTVYSTSLYLKNNISPIVDNNKHNERVQNDISNCSSIPENYVCLQPNDFQKNKIDKIVFQCRESSPTASNLDWNPLPKPKRINSDSTIKDINNAD